MVRDQDELTWIRLGLNPMTDVLIRKGDKRHTHREEGHCRVRQRDWSYTVTSQGMPKATRAGRSKEGFFSRVFHRSTALQTP